MNFREFNVRILEPGSMWLMVIGVVALCQPWIQVLAGVCHQSAVAGA